jgi:lysophospholipase L1-like esterase
MKTILALAALLTLVQLRAFAAPMDPIDPAKYPAPVKVACVGDSITQGAGAPPNMAYPLQLQGLLGAQWQVKNFGVGGRTLLKKGDHPYWIEKAYKDAQDFQPDVVIIMLGTNDTKVQNWAHKDDFVADYKELVETFKNLASKPRVYICRPTPVPEPGNYRINETNLDVEIPWINQLATDENVGLIDMHAPFADKAQLFPDRVHPNAEGAKIMAQTAAAALTGKPAAP